MSTREIGTLDSYLGRAIYSALIEQSTFVFTSVVEGHNPNVSMGTTEDVWDLGDDFVYLTAASQYTITSSSIEDAPSMAGMPSIIVRGLDQNWNHQVEVVTLNGTTPVNTVNSYIRPSYCEGWYPGTTNPNIKCAGNITIDAGADPQMYIPAGEVITRNSMRTVPSGYNGFVQQGSVSTAIGNKGDFSVDFETRLEGNIFIPKIQLNVSSGTNVPEYYDPFLGLLPEKTDIKARATSLSGTAEIRTKAIMLLIKEDYYNSLLLSV